jgi:hypothetical protein
VESRCGLEAALAQPLAQGLVGGEAVERGSERRGAAGGVEHQAVRAVPKVLGRPAARRGHDRPANGHRLDRHEAPRLVPHHREHDGVGRGVGVRQRLAGGVPEPDPVFESERRRERAQLGEVLVVAAAVDRQGGLGRQLGECLDREVDALARVDPPDVADPPGPRLRWAVGEELRVDAGMGDAGVREVEALHRAAANVLADEEPASRGTRVHARGDPAHPPGGAAQRRHARPQLHPAVHAVGVEHPLVADHPERREPGVAHLLHERRGHAAHGPPDHGVRPQFVEVSGEHVAVVTFEREPLARRHARKLVVMPVPAQLAVHVVVPFLLVYTLAAVVGGEHPDLVPGLALAHRGATPDELLAAQVVGWVHAADGQDAHERAHDDGWRPYDRRP